MRPQENPRVALSRSVPIHLMGAKGCYICFAEFGTVNDNFQNIWRLTSKDIGYNLPIKQTTNEARDTTIAAIHNIPQRHRSQAYSRVYMVPGDTKDNRANVGWRYKINTSAGVNVMPLSVFRRLCPAMFDSIGKALEKLHCLLNTLRACGGGINRLE